MLKQRIIPCLLLSEKGLVKTRKFSNPQYVGDPINAIHIFNEKEVDELIVLDICASKEQREPDYEMIGQFADECFMPLCYGGGIRSLDQAQRIFSLGVEKVCLQTAALDNIHLISEIAEQFGSQSVVVSADIKTNWFGKKRLYSYFRGENLKLSCQEYVLRSIDAGAGEIYINSVDNDGMMGGMDLDLIQKISAITTVPLIAAGGCSGLHDMKLAIQAGANAVAVGAFFVFQGPHRAVLITYPNYCELEKLLGDSN